MPGAAAQATSRSGLHPCNVDCRAVQAQSLCAGNILHGDLTAGNVLLSADDADFRGFSAKVPIHPCPGLAPVPLRTTPQQMPQQMPGPCTALKYMLWTACGACLSSCHADSALSLTGAGS